MSILRDFEKRLEGAVEGFFARAFRSGLQPVELAKAIQRYESNYQQVGVDDRVLVPNVYRFTLSPTDLERFSGFTRSLQRELADVARRTADERGWQTQGPIRIEFERSEEIRVGTFQLRGKTEAPGAPRPAAPQPAPHQAPQPAPQPPTQPAPQAAAPPAAAPAPQPAAPAAPGAPPSGQPAFSATLRDIPTEAPAAAPPAPSAPAAADAGGTAVRALRAVDGPDAGRVYPLPQLAVIGRLPECEITIKGASVSRRHARIQREGDRWTITDLGSTNGIRVNGVATPVSELTPGDRVEIGGVTFAFMVTSA